MNRGGGGGRNMHRGGGRQGGGAHLTPFGVKALAHLERLEEEARSALSQELKTLETMAQSRKVP